ncbi:MAG: hypothetical protein AB7O56_12505 [Bauldia sp.]
MRFKFAVAFAVAMAAAGAAEACPNYNLRAAFGTITLPGGFLPDPYVRNVTAGGGYHLGNCGFNANGWVASAPDFQFSYSAAGYPLTIAINSNTDTVLLINAPDGSWHFSDDDGIGPYGLGAAIYFPNPLGGVYDIWIGTYNQASGIPAQLVITEQ